MRSAGLILILAIAGQQASAQGADVSSADLSGSAGIAAAGLSDADNRRLTFYSDKIITELASLVATELEGDGDGALRHRVNLKTTVERYLASATKIGLSENDVDRFFRRRFAGTFTGRVPPDMADDLGIVSIASLMAGLGAVHQNGGAGGSYVNSIRDVGSRTFGE